MSPPTPKRRKRPGQGAPDNQPKNSTPANKANLTGAQAAQLVADPRFRRRVQRLEKLGSRIVGELLAQLCTQYGCQRQVEKWIDSASEHEAAIREFGFDRWPDAHGGRSYAR